MSEDIPLSLLSPPGPMVAEDGAPHQLSQTGVVAPSAPDVNIEALVNSLVQARLEDSQRQFVAQLNMWKSREAELLQHQERLSQDIEQLNEKLQGLPQREYVFFLGESSVSANFRQ